MRCRVAEVGYPSAFQTYTHVYSGGFPVCFCCIQLRVERAKSSIEGGEEQRRERLRGGLSVLHLVVVAVVKYGENGGSGEMVIRQ